MHAPLLGRSLFWIAAGSLTPVPTLQAATAPALAIPPDCVVAADGSGGFTTVQAAVASIPRNNRERRIILVRDGTYHEKVRIDAPFVTLRGTSRAGTRLEFAQGADAFGTHPDALGRGVVNLAATADDCVLENLTIENTDGRIGPHAFTVYGEADRTVIIDCNVWSQGADTLSLWREGGGHYYHARLDVRGSVDFICPRGWCFMRDSTITQVDPRASAAVWHDGSLDPDMKFVLRACRFDGPPEWLLGRWHHDAQFYLLNCAFSHAMRDRAPYRVFYPTNGGPPSEADVRRNHDLDASNRWGSRVYFFKCHRAGGDYAWFQDNLASAPGAPRPEEITAAWTFAGSWDPERTDRPVIKKIAWGDRRAEVTFSESVSVRGTPHLVLSGGRTLVPYASGSGTETLVFAGPVGIDRHVEKLDPAGGIIFATQATTASRVADLSLP